MSKQIKDGDKQIKDGDKQIKDGDKQIRDDGKQIKDGYKRNKGRKQIRDGKQIRGFLFLWDEKQKTQRNFNNFVKDFKVEIKIEKTGEILEINNDNMEKIIHLNIPIEFDINKEVKQPFGCNSVFSIGKGYNIPFNVNLDNFFQKHTTLPIITFHFKNNFMYACDST